MKKITSVFNVAALAAVVACSGGLFAVNTQETEKTTAADTAAEKTGAVAKALEELKDKVFNAQPDKGAKFYVYLQSAGWCGPCCAEMPKIVAEYAAMKEAGVEIILLGCDANQEAAQKYLTRFNAPFPGVMVQDGRKLPGYQSTRGIPHATIVTADGKLVKADYAQLIMPHWRKIIEAAK